MGVCIYTMSIKSFKTIVLKTTWFSLIYLAKWILSEVNRLLLSSQYILLLNSIIEMSRFGTSDRSLPFFHFI